jgi:hypothetical protein
VAGLLGGTERKSVEPMALAQGVDRRQLQHFVGVSPWDHAPLLEQLQAEVARELGDSQGVLVVDGSSVPKKGTESVGVARQWCGRLGKVDNCQVGIFLGYAAKGSCALIDERLYLPRVWARDRSGARRPRSQTAVTFQKPWCLADEMLREMSPRLPHRWIVADTEYGRSSLVRDRLAARGERYMLEVPSNISVRKLAGKAGRRPGWHRVTDFVKRRPIGEWRRFTVRDGQKGPVEVIATAYRVHTRRRGKPHPEILLHICGRSRAGWFQLARHTDPRRMRATLQAVKQELVRRRHTPIEEQGQWLRRVVGGYFNYHAVPTNSVAIGRFRTEVMRLWIKQLRQRSHKHRMPWARADRLCRRWLPPARIRHPWADERFDARTRGKSPVR